MSRKVFSKLLLSISLTAIVSACSPKIESPPGMAAPLPPNRTIISGDVIEAKIVESTTLNILPRQPIVILRFRVESAKAVENEANFFDGRPGDVVTLYSKELAHADLATNKIIATVSVMGDERGSRLWARKISVPK